MPTLQELRETRGAAIKQAREILERAETENRAMRADEKANYEKAFSDAAALKDRIGQLERQREVDREAAEVEARHTADPRATENPEAYRQTREEFRGLFLRSHVATQRGVSAFSPLNKTERKRLDELESQLRGAKAYRAWGRFLGLGMTELSQDERRDLQMGMDPGGGFTVPPEQFQATLLRKVDDYVFIRQRATKVVVVKAQDLGVPTLEDNPADADWTTELAVGADDTTMDFGKRAFAPHPLAKQIRVSKKLLRASAIDIPELIANRFAYKFGITQENAFLLGTGAGQPLGVFTASNNGIDTSRDVSTGNTATNIGADNLRNVKYSLKAPYRRNAIWMFHRTGIQAVSVLKDAMGQYLWRPGLQEGDPDMVLGMPVLESEYVPNTFTASQYVGILGDFSYYWIADSLEMTVQRLVELYAASNQEGFIMRMELDAMPVFAEAFARVQLAA